MLQGNKNALLFIFFTILIDVIGLGIIIPIMPKFLMQIGETDNNGAAKLATYLMLAYSVPQFFFAPIIGSLSDQYGRRPILLLSMLGFGLDYLILAFAPNFILLFIGRLISGITGASISTASAYISDISTDDNRTKNFGMIGMAFGLGFIIGPVLGGFLSTINLKLPFFFAAALSLINALFGFFILPESLAKEKRNPFSLRKANPFNVLKFVLNNKILSGFSIVFLLLFVAASSVHATWNFYVVEKFKWSEMMIGISLAIVGVLVGLCQAVLAQKTIKIIGIQKTIFYGIALYALGCFLFGFAPKGWMIFLFLFPYCLGGIAQPALQTIMTKSVSEKEQGKLQGVITSLQSFSAIIGPAMMLWIFGFFTKEGNIYVPGAPYYLGAILYLLASIVAFTVLKNQFNKNAETQ